MTMNSRRGAAVLASSPRCRSAPRAAPLALVLIAALVLAGCGDDLARDGEVLAPSARLVVVAHPDDDLIFMARELTNWISAGESLTTVYVTAGQGRAGLGVAGARVRGVLAAYGAMARQQRWSCGVLMLRDLPFFSCRHARAPITLLFLSLPDGGKRGELAGSLRSLWWGDVPAVTTVAHQPARVDRAQLLEVLEEVVRQTSPREVHTLDFAAGHGRDHSDHLVSAAATALALLRAGGERTLWGHRGYNVVSEPANRGERALAAGARALGFYRACVDDCGRCGVRPCATIDPAHAQWMRRRYVLGRRSLPARGRLQLDGACLQRAGGSAVVLDSCATASSWSLRTDGAIVEPGGACLTVGDDGGLALAACRDDGAMRDAQRFLFDDDGALWSAAAGATRGDPGEEALLSCVGGVAGRPQVTTCAAARPRWSLTRPAVVSARGQLGLSGAPDHWQLAAPRAGAPAALCALDAQGLRCAAGDGRGGFAPATLRSPLRGDPGTLRFGDVDGDGGADACAAAADGVWCALARDDLASPQRWSAQPAQLRRLIDVDGDGLADACELRGARGLCWRSLGDRFAQEPALRWLAPSSSQWLGDLDGDARAEWCAATAEGPACALAADGADDGQGLDAPAALPWGYARAGVVEGGDDEPATLATAQLDDADGDGLADLLSLRAGAASMARGTGAGFAPRSKLAELPGSLLVTGDVDGDGRVDVCTIDESQLHCAPSP
jgi:LmbE family N-acetylglucosaminyl deacetylase